MFEKLYTTGEVAKIFGVSYAAVKKWAYSGKITLKRPAVNTGILRARLRGSSAKHQKAGSRFMLE
ncbi:MAG: helix-turn-helix domain-containing protein [Candidatus Methanoglobus sp.]